MVEKNNKIFNRLCSHRLISESVLKILSSFKKVTNLGKLYFLPKIHKRLANAQGRPVISNSCTPTEKVSEYLDFLLNPVMQDGWSYLKEIGDFLKKIKRLGKIPEGAILVTADVVGPYPDIPHHLGLQLMKQALMKQAFVNYLLKRYFNGFVLKNNYSEFNEKVCKQISEAATGTKFAPLYACIFMDEMEISFLKTQQLQSFICLRYTDDIFFTWTHGGEQLNLFLKDLYEFHPNLKFTYQMSQNSFDF